MNHTLSHDLDDAEIFNRYYPLGVHGDVDLLVSYRDYFPLSCLSKKKQEQQKQDILTFFTTDVYQWFAFDPVDAFFSLCLGIPYKDGLERYGELPYAVETDIYRMVREGSDTSGAADMVKSYLDFAYELCSKNGKQLFSLSGGLVGFEVAEPCLLYLYGSRMMQVVSFKYSDLDRKGTGQILCGFEFHQETGVLTNYHYIYSTKALGSFNANVIAHVAELVKPLVDQYFSHR